MKLKNLREEKSIPYLDTIPETDREEYMLSHLHVSIIYLKLQKVLIYPTASLTLLRVGFQDLSHDSIDRPQCQHTVQLHTDTKRFTNQGKAGYGTRSPRMSTRKEQPEKASEAGHLSSKIAIRF